MSAPQQNNETSRAQRVLTFMSVAIFGLCALSFIALIAAPALGVTDLTVAPWPTILVFPVIGLPVCIVLIIAVLIINIRRRSR
ncbi:hypothetical protein ACFSBZ_08650 [Amnibacterium flavum]|uniref:Multidrug ABC transporter ATPase n=1 Tax=Amnibacterium flavum TaxID=2173173 RepID=A0A2V1HQT2_9MICO|nr:hypothetical protein [Amnibacterium flavum]PVZ93340.1 hypothetical protein DDQ50_15275 [Amnibacterium flavum]